MKNSREMYEESRLSIWNDSLYLYDTVEEFCEIKCMKEIEKAVIDGALCTDVIYKPDDLNMIDIINYLESYGYGVEDIDSNRFGIYIEK